MIYEVHITVAEGQGVPHLFGTNTIRLELESGKNRVQTLVGAREEFSNDLEAIAWTFDLERELVERGYKIIRRKLEAPLTQYKFTPLYSEAHWKFEFEKISDVFKFEDFRRSKEEYDAEYLLSWSLDKKDKAWLTKRFYGDNKYAYDFFLRADRAVQKNFFPLIPVHFEAVIVDTNLDLDEGWVAK